MLCMSLPLCTSCWRVQQIIIIIIIIIIVLLFKLVAGLESPLNSIYVIVIDHS